MKLTFAILLALAAPIVSGQSTGKPYAADNVELTKIYEADQSDRKNFDISSTNMTKLISRDNQRRARVHQFLESGQIRTANDYRHAAFVFQHSINGTDDIRIANALATLAMTLAPNDAANRWIVGASWDRLMTRYLQPQWYGTQSMGDERGFYLYPVAENAVGDAERVKMVGHTLADYRMRLIENAKESHQKLRDPVPTIEDLRVEQVEQKKTH